MRFVNVAIWLGVFDDINIKAIYVIVNVVALLGDKRDFERYVSFY
jgi:hypothetical protein